MNQKFRRQTLTILYSVRHDLGVDAYKEKVATKQRLLEKKVVKL